MTSGTSGLLIPRRKALLGATALAAAPLAAPHIARAADPIKIGLLLAKTGQIAAQTEYLANGSFLALEERNNMIMGQPAELVWLDEPTPQAATQNMQKLVQENKVSAILGGSLSSNALAEEATAAQLKIPFVCNNAAATDISGKNCNRYTFRLNTPVAVQCRMLAPFALTYGKKWYFITASYAFGQDIVKSGRQLLEEAGGTVVGSDEAPLNTPDFSSFILKIRQAKPDVVWGGLSAGDLSTFLKQWDAMGMRGKIPFLEIAIGDTDIWSVGPEAATGTFTALWWYKNPNNTPEEKKFAESYDKKYGKPAADKAWMGWITARSLFESIDAAKSLEPMKIVEALEAWKAPADGYSYSYRKFDHQMMMKNLAVSVKPQITDKWDYFNVEAALPKDTADLDKVFGTEAEVGCKMG
ncbi:ABC transporter substrate-binding protein [Acidisphaera sp. S103]|uniref:ABC transporter substrate-binding protein n=1 Tax=Acidisphaera sp. S103 TaxID=1747223 RepID=UPI00131B88E5|nr:ABC transporter substrate-binding protein [Acidisphaera sp. S103]